jgi:anti-sigma regulatory factor (Ser/Thr protein kinase)
MPTTFAIDNQRRSVHVTIPAGPEAPAHARHVLRDLCERRSRVAELVISELVTNAVRHPDTRPGDAITVDSTFVGARLRISVTDRGTGFTHDGSPPASGRVGGWGLHMVREVCEDWWIERLDDGGTRVVAELRVAADGPARAAA